MPDTIDYKFLSLLNGGSKTLGFIPPAGGPGCGVAIGSSFALGPCSVANLKDLNLSVALINKLTPYLGKTGSEAAELVRMRPLIVTADEAHSIDKAVKAPHLDALAKAYTSSPLNTKGTTFFSLPAEAQTVIASVSLQYGVNLESAVPQFWQAVCCQEWAETIECLNNVGDRFPTRRRQEAALLERLVD